LSTDTKSNDTNRPDSFVEDNRMSNMTRRHAVKLAGAGFGASLMGGLVPKALHAQDTQERPQLFIGTAGKGGVFYPLGTAMADIISRYADLDAMAPQTSGTAENMKLLQEGKIELALAQADMAWAATQGRLAGLPKRVAIRNLLGAHTKHLHLVTLADRGIAKVGDLKGRRFSPGIAGSETELKTLRVLEAHGISPYSFAVRAQLDDREAARQLLDGRLDAIAVDDALPSAVVLEMATRRARLRLVPTGDAVPKITERDGPFYFAGVIPKDTYPGVDHDVSAVAAETLFVAHELMTEDLAYEITKVLLERSQELASASGAAREITPVTAVRGSPVPFHPGALRYYREAGIAVPQS
jgi:TRAP transporter TAXI family solute receptor